MSNKIALPRKSVVHKWNEEKVIKWLKRVELDDCISAFESRHIDGIKLLELNEQKLFTYQDLKIKHRKQIAKCVQEYKHQASNAKRLVTHIKSGQSSQPENAIENGICMSDDDSDDWGSDFEDYDDDENEETSPELNNNNITDEKDISEKISNLNKALENASTRNNSIPQPPDLPVITKPMNGSLRPALKRPPSQPPPPPVIQASSHNELQEDYEIPIGIQSCTNNANKTINENASFTTSSILKSDTTTINETYEFIESPEENYEMVNESSPQKISSEKPMLPPRMLPKNSPSPPPPLPQKPRKLHDSLPVHERSEGVRTFSRPKPSKVEENSNNEACTSPPTTSNIGFFSTLLGRRNSSTPSSSPKIQRQVKDITTSETVPSSNPSFVSSNDDHSSTSTSPERETLISVGSSSFVSLSSSQTSEIKKLTPPPPLPPRSVPSIPEETVNNMATRPLPPVPVVKSELKPPIETLQDMQTYPWFHEIERQDAEELVRALNQTGSFVVRPSKRAGKDNPYSLTILHEDKLFHLNIRLRPDNSYALGKEKKKEKTFPTIAELINYHQKEPILLTSRGEPAGHTILHKYPEKK